MPYDPNFPADHVLIEAPPFRDQFQSLKALIDALTSINAAQIDGVSTVNPGDPATASVAVVGSTLGFTFGLPRGDVGLQGNPGGDGNPGPVGPQGPPFANAVVDAVNTLPAGSPATVSVSFDGTLVHFVFDLPAGQNGSNGSDGAQGPPGEVTNAALAASISGTSSNSNAVPTLGLVVSDPPTQGEMQSLANKMDELILVLRR